MTDGLFDLPWPIRPYPQNPPPTPEWIATAALKRLGAAELPECIIVHDGTELPARYEIARDGICYLQAVKINGSWHDPIKWFSKALIDVFQNECAEIERDAKGSE